MDAMASPVHQMTVAQYDTEGRSLGPERVIEPTWNDVEAAIRRMDNYCFPFICLNTDALDPEDEGLDSFWIIGGGGRWALLQASGDWQYEDAAGGNEEVRLWDSDQGYFCKQKNILTDPSKVLRITRAYYDTGSYAGLDSVA